jgi:hypothetical protein
MTGFDRFSVPTCLAVFASYPARMAAMAPVDGLRNHSAA